MTGWPLNTGCQKGKIWQRSFDEVLPHGLCRRIFSILIVVLFIYYLLMLFLCIMQLIRRRYFSNELLASSPWSLTPREDTILPVEIGNDEDLFQRKRWCFAFSFYCWCMHAWWNAHPLGDCSLNNWISLGDKINCLLLLFSSVTLATLLTILCPSVPFSATAARATGTMEVLHCLRSVT
jgi:ABC-type glycerol-3-phosphate transport system permease component